MKRIRANQFMFFVDAWLGVLRALREGNATTRYVMESGPKGDGRIEFEIRVTRVNDLAGPELSQAMRIAREERGK